MTEREKMVSGEMYDPSDAELTELRFKARRIFEKFNATAVDAREERIKLLKQLFKSTGKNLYIEPSFKCDYGCNIIVGENFYMNFDCIILDVAEVKIGDNCMIAPQVAIYTATHPIDPALRNSGRELGKPVTIGDNCWIGGHATINPGVTLGNNVVVGAGSVVTKNFGDNVVIAGNPAKIIKEITNF